MRSDSEHLLHPGKEGPHMGVLYCFVLPAAAVVQLDRKLIQTPLFVFFGFCAADRCVVVTILIPSFA